MIDFHTVWLPQILGYAKLVADENVLRRAWLAHNLDETSVVSPDELIEQVFGDLDAVAIAEAATAELVGRLGLASEVKDFLRYLQAWDAARGGVPIGPELFSTPEWLRLRAQAAELVALNGGGDTQPLDMSD